MAVFNKVYQLVTDEICRNTRVQLFDCPTVITLPKLQIAMLAATQVAQDPKSQVYIFRCPEPEGPSTDPTDLPGPVYDKVAFAYIGGVYEINLELGQTTGSPSFQYFGAANNTSFPFIRCMTINRATNTIYTVKNHNTGILKDEIWKHIRGVSSAFLVAMDEAVSSTSAAGLSWDPVTDAGYVGHGRSGGFDAILGKFTTGGVYTDRYTDLHPEIFDDWSGGAVFIKDGVFFVAADNQTSFHSFDNIQTTDATLVQAHPSFKTYNNGVAITKLQWSARQNKWYYRVGNAIYRADVNFNGHILVRSTTDLVDFVVYDNQQQIYYSLSTGIKRFSIDKTDAQLPVSGPDDTVFTAGTSVNCLELFDSNV